MVEGEEIMFSPLKPGEIVREFLDKHPNPTIKDRLLFLIDHFPQTQNGRTIYLIDGGAAMSLLRPGSRTSESIDVDIVTVDPDLERSFANVRDSFGVVTVTHWLGQRGFPYTSKAEEFIMASACPVTLGDGKVVLVLSPEILAFSKIYPTHRWRGRRLKDIVDVAKLGIREEVIRRIYTRLSHIQNPEG